MKLLILIFVDVTIMLKDVKTEVLTKKDIMRKKVGITLLIIALCVIGRFGFGKYIEMYTGKMRAAAMVPKVKLSEVQEVEIANSIEAPGRINAKYSVDIVSKVQGTLLKKHFTEGDYVRQGQLLFTIDPQEYSIALRKAQADLQNARAQANKASKDYLRAKELVAKDFIAKSTFDDNLAQKDIALASIKSASAAVNDARRLLSYTSITSPVSGRIGMVNVTEGNYVTIQTGSLAKVVSLDPIYVTYSVDSKQFNQLRNDSIIKDIKAKLPIKVELTLADGTKYKHFGNEDFFGNEISQSTGSIPLRATFKNPEHTLLPGDFVKVRIYSNAKNKKLIVPKGAVLQDTAGRYVFIIDKENKAQQVYINTDGEHGNNFIVTSGLSKGDKYISDGIVKVAAGMRVDPMSEEEAEQTADAGSKNGINSSEVHKK